MNIGIHETTRVTPPVQQPEGNLSGGTRPPMVADIDHRGRLRSWSPRLEEGKENFRSFHSRDPGTRHPSDRSFDGSMPPLINRLINRPLVLVASPIANQIFPSSRSILYRLINDDEWVGTRVSVGGRNRIRQKGTNWCGSFFRSSFRCTGNLKSMVVKEKMAPNL